MKTGSHRLGKYLLIFPLLFTMLFGAAIGGIGSISLQSQPRSCPPHISQVGSCICAYPGGPVVKCELE